MTEVHTCPACGAELERQTGREQFVCTKGHTLISPEARRVKQ